MQASLRKRGSFQKFAVYDELEEVLPPELHRATSLRLLCLHEKWLRCSVPVSLGELSRLLTRAL